MKKIVSLGIISTVVLTGCATKEFVNAKIDLLDKKQTRSISTAVNSIENKIAKLSNEIKSVSRNFQGYQKDSKRTISNLTESIQLEIRKLDNKINKNEAASKEIKEMYEALQNLFKNLKTAAKMHSEGIKKQYEATNSMIKAFDEVSGVK